MSKSDWKPLRGRDVVIWPDNDKAGFEASDSIYKELREIGVKSLREVDRLILAKECPPKWDLADPLPDGKKDGFFKEMLLRASRLKVEGFQNKTENVSAKKIEKKLISRIPSQQDLEI